MELSNTPKKSNPTLFNKSVCERTLFYESNLLLSTFTQGYAQRQKFHNLVKPVSSSVHWNISNQLILKIELFQIIFISKSNSLNYIQTLGKM